ncbi:MAG TPA: CBS and ACT domain-containing protein [Anaerolineales bacterium]|nr:CBS and ACT domain-containing protein [Anaerolineales bacterium]
MLVGERMSRPPITIGPEMSINDALALFKKERIRRAPVIKGGKLVGIVSEKDLLNASPSPATTLSIWEMNYLLSKLTVSEVMTKNVITVAEDTPIEEAARIMADNKIGGLPVVKGARVVGIITETNLFKMFLELMGAREKGVRVTALIEDQPGTLAKVTRSIADAGGNFIAFGQFVGEDVNTRVITFKVNGMDQAQVKKVLTPLIKKLWDIREV